MEADNIKKVIYQPGSEVNDEPKDFSEDYDDYMAYVKEKTQKAADPLQIKIYQPESPAVGHNTIDDTFDPMGQMYYSVLNTPIGARYDSSALMVAGAGGAELEQDYLQVQCRFSLMPGSRKCWKGSECRRTHGQYTEYIPTSGTMIGEISPKKPLLPEIFPGKVTWVSSKDIFYLAPYSFPENNDWDLPDPKYDWNISVDQISKYEQELNALMNLSSIKRKFTHVYYVSGELVAANLGPEFGWKRAVILSKAEDDLCVDCTGNPMTKIQLIDSGEICKVPYTSLLRLPPKFVVHPPMAYMCTFKDTLKKSKMTTESLSKLLHARVKVEVDVAAIPSALDLNYGYGTAWGRYGFSEKVPYEVKLWKDENGVKADLEVTSLVDLTETEQDGFGHD